MKHQSIPEEVMSHIEEMIPKDPPIKPPPTQPIESGASPIFIEGSFSRGLDESADMLIKLLSPAIRDYICELADITLHIPRWQLLLGSLMSQYESGSITQPSIDPAWRQLNVIMGDSTCEWCKVRFTPKRFGQNVCSQKCGDEKRKSEILTRNKARDALQQQLREAKREQIVI